MATKRKPRTIQLIDGKWYRLAHGGPPFWHECCSCGLVHKVAYKVENGSIWEQWTMDDELTDEARKASK